MPSSSKPIERRRLASTPVLLWYGSLWLFLFSNGSVGVFALARLYCCCCNLLYDLVQMPLVQFVQWPLYFYVTSMQCHWMLFYCLGFYSQWIHVSLLLDQLKKKVQIPKALTGFLMRYPEDNNFLTLQDSGFRIFFFFLSVKGFETKLNMTLTSWLWYCFHHFLLLQA